MRMYTIEKVCKKFGVTRQALSRWRRMGQFPEPVMIGKRPFWTERGLIEWIEAGGINGS